MLKHHFLVFFRSLIRQKANSVITLSGIVLGLTAVLLAYAFIADEQGVARGTLLSKMHRLKVRLKQQVAALPSSRKAF